MFLSFCRDSIDDIRDVIVHVRQLPSGPLGEYWRVHRTVGRPAEQAGAKPPSQRRHIGQLLHYELPGLGIVNQTAQAGREVRDRRYDGRTVAQVVGERAPQAVILEFPPNNSCNTLAVESIL